METVIDRKVRAMKKLINRVEDIVPEALQGLGAAHPDVVKIDLPNSNVLRAACRRPPRGDLARLRPGASASRYSA